MEGGFRASIDDLGTQFGLYRLDEHGPSLKMRFGGPSPLVTWAQQYSTNPAQIWPCALRAGPELFETVA